MPNHTPSTLLPLYPLNILSRDSIPSRHIFLHASAKACFFATGKRGTRFRDATLEAVLVHFLGRVLASSGIESYIIREKELKRD
jgi:hypothetical protein